VTGVEVIIENFIQKGHKMLPRTEGRKFSMLIDDACHYFVLLYLKAKTKNLNKNYLNKNHLTTSLIPGRAGNS